MSPRTGEERQTEIMRLTEAAVKAAQEGQWDVVMQCYQDRGALLGTGGGAVREAENILKLDEQIRVRVTTAQAVLTSLLSEATATRRRLEGFRRRLDELPQAPESVSVEA